MENKELQEFNNIQTEELESFIEQNISENLNHARHVETEIHTFTGIYMAVVAGVLAFNFTGKDSSSFSVIVHFILLGGGLLAMFLLNRWYTAFDVFMAHAEGLSFIKENMILGKITSEEAIEVWKKFTAAISEAVENREPRPQKAAFAALDEKYQEARKAVPGFFAFKIPKRGGKGPSTRDFIFGFHGVILIAVAIILISDLYKLVF